MNRYVSLNPRLICSLCLYMLREDYNGYPVLFLPPDNMRNSFPSCLSLLRGKYFSYLTFSEAAVLQGFHFQQAPLDLGSCHFRAPGLASFFIYYSGLAPCLCLFILGGDLFLLHLNGQFVKRYVYFIITMFTFKRFFLELLVCHYVNKNSLPICWVIILFSLLSSL